MSEQSPPEHESIDPETWQAILDRAREVLPGLPNITPGVIDNRYFARLYETVILKCSETEVALPCNLALGKETESDNRQAYNWERLRVRTAKELTHLYLRQYLRVTRKFNNNFIFDTIDPKFDLAVLHTFDPLAVGSEVAEHFSFETDPVSLVHEIVRPDLFDVSQGELQETDPHVRLGAYLLHGCEPAYLTEAILSGS